jgi:hypothetical protein
MATSYRPNTPRTADDVRAPLTKCATEMAAGSSGRSGATLYRGIAFHLVRHYGLFANGHRAAMLARCRELLGVSPAPAEADGSESNKERRGAKAAVPTCPCCGGPMRIIEHLPGPSSRRYPARKPDGW